jgi:hypothetical protein
LWTFGSNYDRQLGRESTYDELPGEDQVKVGSRGKVIQSTLDASMPKIVQANTDYCASKHEDGTSLFNEAYEVTCDLDSWVHVTITNS